MAFASTRRSQDQLVRVAVGELRKADRSTGLFDRVAAGFTGHRDPRLTEHSVRTLVAQRITCIALRYDDLNDHDDLGRAPALALLAGKLEARRKGCAPRRADSSRTAAGSAAHRQLLRRMSAVKPLMTQADTIQREEAMSDDR